MRLSWRSTGRSTVATKSDLITSKTAELDQGRNELTRLLHKVFSESALATLAITSVVLAVMSLLIAWVAVSEATRADIRSELLVEQLEDVKDEVEVLEVYILNLEKKQ